MDVNLHQAFTQSIMHAIHHDCFILVVCCWLTTEMLEKTSTKHIIVPEIGMVTRMSRDLHVQGHTSQLRY